MLAVVTGKDGGMQTMTVKTIVHRTEKILHVYPNHPRFKYLGGKPCSRPWKRRTPWGTAYVIFRNNTADVTIELKAVFDAK